jgi:transcription elongation factor Elf1
MSKQLPARIHCPNCDNQFEVMLYRSIWIENRENRKLIFDDQINAVTCSQCKVKTKLEFPFLCTNVNEHIAVWYEPYPDPEVDKDVKQYAKHFGSSSFYATAPRIRDWKAFKEKIIELEQRIGIKPAGKPSPEMQEKMRGFINHIKEQQTQAKPSPANAFAAWWRSRTKL